MTLLPVEGDVLGWGRHPFRREPPVDYTGWTDQQTAAEMQRRFGDGANELRPFGTRTVRHDGC